MATYPTAIVDLPEPTSGTYEDDPGFLHDIVHRDVAREIEAVETELGTDPSGAFTTVKARLNDVDARTGDSPLYVGPTAPPSPSNDWVWIDTSGA
jgi:hypothetical protein